MRERRGHGSLTDAAIYICRDGYVLKKNMLEKCSETLFTEAALCAIQTQ